MNDNNANHPRIPKPAGDTPALHGSTPTSSRDGGPFRVFMAKLFLVVVLLAGLAFVYKLWEFFEDLTDSAGLRFAGAHLMTYLLVAGGFLALLGYSFLKGHFADIEQPKHDLLEMEAQRDHAEFGI